MRIRPLPKKWLIHDMVYTEKTGEKDDWGNPVIKEPVTVKHVRYDESTVFSRDSSQTKVLADGVIFVDAVNSDPFLDFKEDSKIQINDKELTIKKAIPCYHPTENSIHHYELEVI